MPRYGNSSVSSLLAAAEAARKRQESLEDSIASYEWDLSEKSPEDYRKYVEHLGKRAESYRTAEPQKALEYQKKVTSAQRSLVSAEISRATTQILYGNMTNRQKYQTITNLYQQAAETGDEALMQRLEGQAARLSVTIQNEDIAAQNARAAGAGRAAAANKKQINGTIKEVERAAKQLEMDFQSGLISLDEYATNLGDEKNGVFAQKQAILEKAINNPNFDGNEQNTFVDKLNSMYDSANFKRFSGPALKQMAESRPYAIRIDPFTGERTIEKRKVAGQVGGEPGNLNTIFNSPAVDLNKVKSGDAQFLDVARGLTKEVGSPQENFQFQVFNSQVDGSPLKDRMDGKEFNYYIDPVTGKEIAYDPNANATRMPLEIAERNKRDTERWQNELKDGTIEDFKRPFKDIGQFIAGNNLLSSAAQMGLGTALGPLGGIAGMFGMNKLQEQVNTKKAELAAKQEADRKARAELSAREAAEAQRVLSSAPGAAAARPVFSAANRTVKTNAPFNPQYYAKKLPQPQRAQATIQNALQSPFKKNSKLPF